LSVLRELENAGGRAGRRGMAFGNEDVAVRRDEDGVRLREIPWRPRAAGRAERHEQLAVGAELVDLVALARVGPRRRSRSAATAHGAAMPRAAGSLYRPVTVLYGFGGSFTGARSACAWAAIRAPPSRVEATASEYFSGRTTSIEALRGQAGITCNVGDPTEL